MDEELRDRLLIVAGILAFIFFLAWCLIPVEDSMTIETIEWQWKVDVLQYQSCPETVNSLNKGGKFGSRRRAVTHTDETREKLVPSDAYDITTSIREGTDRRKIGEDADGNALYTYDTYYYLVFSYRVDRWMPFNSIYASGYDDKPHEPDRPYPLTNDITEPKVGMYSCVSGHTEYYHVNGVTDGKKKAFTISQADWKRLHDTNVKEIWFRHGRFDDEIQDMCFEKEDL